MLTKCTVRTVWWGREEKNKFYKREEEYTEYWFRKGLVFIREWGFGGKRKLI